MDETKKTENLPAAESAPLRGGGDTVPGGEPSADTPAAEEFRERVLGEFRLLRRLGRGGMAEVYLAEQTSLHRQVAVKILRPDRLADADDVLIRRFEQEARAAAALSHPNIVQVYSIGEQDGIHYIAQEYVQGLNLREFLRKKGPPELPLALHLMKQIAAGLQKAGEAGIVHRDIKPENIMITRKGVAKIADFGLAQLTQGGERTNLTQVGVTMGTPLYMSPEQIHGRKVDHRSDLYSFGVTCYHLLAGHPPFRGETAISVAVQHLKTEPPPLGTVRPDLPPALSQIVQRLMAKEPDGRYASAQAVLRDLKQVESVLKQSPDAVTRLELAGGAAGRGRRIAGAVGRRVSRWPVGGRAAAYAAGCLLLALLAATLGWWLRPGNPLEAAPADPDPPRHTVDRQYAMASVVEPDNEDAWRAVIDHFDDPLYEPKAQEQLAQLYLRQLRLDEAEKLFEKLAGHTEARFQATGFAGQAVIANLRGDYSQSQNLIEGRLKPLRGAFDENSELARYVAEAERRNKAQSGGRS